MKNYQNARILHDFCPKDHQNTRFFYYICPRKKNNKIPEFYTIFCQKMPEFYILIARKIFFPDFFFFLGGGGHVSSLPPYPMPMGVTAGVIRGVARISVWEGGTGRALKARESRRRGGGHWGVGRGVFLPTGGGV